MSALRITRARAADAAVLLSLIRDLASYERLSSAVVATEADIRRALGGDPPPVEALIARVGDDPVGFALFFHTFSTFVGRRGIYLEDLFVKPEARRKGYGSRLLAEVARLAVARGCGRLEWAVLNWNELAQRVYRQAGARPLNEWTVWRLAGAELECLGGQSSD